MNTIINSFITWKKVNESEVQFDADSIGVYVPQGATVSPGFDTAVTPAAPKAQGKPKAMSTAKIEKKEAAPKKEEAKDKTKLTNDDLVEIAKRLGKWAKVVNGKYVEYKNTSTNGFSYYLFLSGRAHFGNESYSNFEECKGAISKRNGYWVVTYDKGGTVDLGTYVTRTEPTEKGTYKGADLSQKRK